MGKFLEKLFKALVLINVTSIPGYNPDRLSQIFMDIETISCLVSCIICCIVVFVFLAYFGILEMPGTVITILYLSAAIPVVMVSGCIPYDVSLSMFGANNNKETLRFFLEMMYWVSFVLTWIFVPLAVSYLGYSHTISVKHRIWMTIRENLIFYGVALLIIVLGLTFLLSANKISFKSIFPLVIALGNGYGLLVLCLLLGYGFISLPRALWNYSNPSFRYKKHLSDMFRETQKCSFIVADAEAAIHYYEIAKESIPYAHKEMFKSMTDQRMVQMNTLKAEIPIPDRFFTSKATNKKMDKVRGIKWNNVSPSELEDFFCLLDTTSYSLKQMTTFILDTSKDAVNALHQMKQLSQKSQKSFSFYKILSIFVSTFVAICYWGELSLVFKRDISPFYLLSHLKVSPLVGQMLITFPILSFMLFIGGWSLTKVQLGSFFRFIKGATNANTFNYWALILCRLGPTIAYHYLLQIGAKKTEFNSVMGVMDQVIFVGTSWNYVSPVLLIMCSLFVYFDVWDNVIGCLGFGSLAFDSVLSQNDLEIAESVLKDINPEAVELLTNKGLSIGSQKESNILPVEEALL